MEFAKSKTATGLNGQTANVKVEKHVKISLETARTLQIELSFSMYSIPPLGHADLSQVQQLVEERIRLLKVFDKKPVSIQTDFNADCPGSLKSMLLQVPGPDSGNNFYADASSKLKTLYTSARERDVLSHFFLRLYCCRSPELIKWFLWHEVRYLKFQLMDRDNRETISDFMACNNLLYDECDPEKAKAIYQGHYLFRDSEPPNVYMVPFKEALDCVRRRRSVIEKGIAYVIQDDMVGIICSRFRVELSQAMAKMAQKLPRLEEDDRLIPEIHEVYHEQVTVANQRAQADAMLKSRSRISPEMVDKLAVESFPPCMRFIHENLRQNHHLKHYGRLYYGLFLKSIGMTVEDAIEFFKKEFVQSMTPEKFAKEYSYNIRYNYGQEGKKVSLSAYGCQKIINSNPPGAGDSHGCPFRHQDSKNLEVMLRRYGIDDQNIAEMLEIAKQKDYTGACTKYFKCKHPDAVIRAENGLIYHPNQFFAESRRALSGIYDPKPESTDGLQEESQEGSQEKDQTDDDDLFDPEFDNIFPETCEMSTDAEKTAGDEAIENPEVSETQKDSSAMEVDEDPAKE